MKNAIALLLVFASLAGAQMVFWDVPYMGSLGVNPIDPVPIRDDMESYTDGAVVNGLNGGSGWDSAYVDRPGVFGIQSNDTMESYGNGVAVNGLNGGNGWSAAYVDR